MPEPQNWTPDLSQPQPGSDGALALGWTWPAARAACDDHKRGTFALSWQLWTDMPSLPAISAALARRLAVPCGLPWEVTGPGRAPGRLETEAARELWERHLRRLLRSTLSDVAGMGFSVWQHPTAVNPVTLRREVLTVERWPLSQVRWTPTPFPDVWQPGKWIERYYAIQYGVGDSVGAVLFGPQDPEIGRMPVPDEARVPGGNGVWVRFIQLPRPGETDGHWTMIGEGDMPHLDGRVTALDVSYVGGAIMKRSGFNLTKSLGRQSPVGELPGTTAVNSQEGKDLQRVVAGLGVSDAAAVLPGGAKIGSFSLTTQNASLFTEFTDLNIRDVALALLGRGGAVAKEDAQYQNPEEAEVPEALVRSQVRLVEVGFDVLTNALARANSADTAPIRLLSHLPNTENEQRIAAKQKQDQAEAAKLSAFHGAVYAERGNGFEPDQARLNTIAASCGVEAPLIPATGLPPVQVREPPATTTLRPEPGAGPSMPDGRPSAPATDRPATRPVAAPSRPTPASQEGPLSRAADAGGTKGSRLAQALRDLDEAVAELERLWDEADARDPNEQLYEDEARADEQQAREYQRETNGRFAATGRSKAASEARAKTKTAQDKSAASKTPKQHAAAEKAHRAAADAHKAAAKASRSAEHRASHERVAKEHLKAAMEHKAHTIEDEPKKTPTEKPKKETKPQTKPEEKKSPLEETKPAEDRSKWAKSDWGKAAAIRTDQARQATEAAKKDPEQLVHAILAHEDAAHAHHRAGDRTTNKDSKVAHAAQAKIHEKEAQKLRVERAKWREAQEAPPAAEHGQGEAHEALFGGGPAGKVHADLNKVTEDFSHQPQAAEYAKRTADVEKMVGHMPANVQQAIHKMGVRHEVVGQLGQGSTATLAGDKTIDGRPWEKVGGVYMDGPGRAYTAIAVSSRPGGTALHEIGHAVDFKTTGREKYEPHSSEPWFKAFHEGASKKGPDGKSAIDKWCDKFGAPAEYFHGTGGNARSGRMELFAELWHQSYASGRTRADVDQHFPGYRKMMAENLYREWKGRGAL